MGLYDINVLQSFSLIALSGDWDYSAHISSFIYITFCYA